MITHLYLQNFQCHRRLAIDFKSTKVITGASDRGKSAIVRALRWVLFNDLSGDRFITRNQKVCRVRVVFADGSWLERSRGPKTNTYRFKPTKGEATTYSALKPKVVPATIAEYLRLEPSVNLQRQHDAPFWLSLPDTQAASALNRIVHLNRLDEGIAKAQNLTRQLRARVEARQRDIEQTEAALASLPDTGPLEALTQKLEKLPIERPTEGLESFIAQVIQARENAKQGANLVKLRAAAARIPELNPTGPLKSLLRGVVEVETQLQDLEVHADEIRQQLAKIKVCPTCKQPITKHRSKDHAC